MSRNGTSALLCKFDEFVAVFFHDEVIAMAHLVTIEDTRGVRDLGTSSGWVTIESQALFVSTGCAKRPISTGHH